MRSKILHESAGRMRVHFYQKHMRIAEADKLEYFLNSLCFVNKATVSERSCNAVIVYDKNCREKLLSELASVYGYFMAVIASLFVMTVFSLTLFARCATAGGGV